MLVPNAMLAHLIRGIVAESPHEVAKIRALARTGAVGTSAYAQHQRQVASARRTRSATTPLSEDTTAALVQLKAIDAETMVRAMIAAAAADGEIDKREESRILRYLRDAAATPAEYAYARAQMQRPASPDELAASASDKEAAVEIYAAALLASQAATPAGRDFLARLATALALPTDFVAELHASWGDPAPLPARAGGPSAAPR